MIMTFGVVAPEYFPTIEWTALALSVDVLVVADTFQYVRQSRQNRARLRTPTGAQWITIPLVGGQYGRPISSVEIDPGSDWRRVHPKSLQYNYGGAAYYEHYVDRVAGVMTNTTDRLAPVSAASIRWVMEVLSADTRILQASELPGAPDTFRAIRSLFPSDRAMVLPGRRGRVGSLEEGDAVVTVASFDYRQAFAGFEAGLSVLDLLMNHGPSSGDLIRRHCATVRYSGAESDVG